MAKTAEVSKLTSDLWTGIRRLQNGHVAVQVQSQNAAGQDGVICLNPDAGPRDWIMQKVFAKKPVYLPDQYDEAMNKHVRGQNVVVVSMNGYSSLKAEWLAQYRIQPGAYEAACAELLIQTIKHMKKKFQAVKVQVIHGASHMGIDGVIDRVAKNEFSLMPLGFSCPEFMMYVNDDDTPVYVGKDKADYADKYIRSLDLLVTTGGRIHALEHDTLASCIYDKRLHFVDIPNMLSPVGVPARIVKPDGSVVIENAAAAFGRNISFSDSKKVRQHAPADGDDWDGLFLEMGSVATEVARKVLKPEHMFKTL